MKINGILTVLLFILIISISPVTGSSYQTPIPKPELPILISSCGQSPGATMLKVIISRLKLQHEPEAFELNALASAEDLIARKKTGDPFKTLIIVMGASLKGMGAAGISIDDELARTASLIKEAREQGLTLIGAHIEGIKRRAQGADVGDNTDELSIDAVAPFVDLLIINVEGNEDNRFTDISQEKNIPMIEVEKNIDLLNKLGDLFKQ